MLAHLTYISPLSLFNSVPFHIVPFKLLMTFFSSLSSLEQELKNNPPITNIKNP